MQTDPISTVGLLAATDPTGCDRAGLARMVESSHRLRAWLDALDATIASCAARLATDGSCEEPAALLRGDGRCTSREADAVARRGEVCDLLPRLHAALAEGAVSAGHADVVGRVAAGLDRAGRAQLCELEGTIVAAAASAASVEAFQREMSTLAGAVAPRAPAPATLRQAVGRPPDGSVSHPSRARPRGRRRRRQRVGRGAVGRAADGATR